jgi:hypothetical protein
MDPLLRALREPDSVGAFNQGNREQSKGVFLFRFTSLCGREREKQSSEEIAPGKRGMP